MEQRRFIIKAGKIAEQAQPFSHPWNPNSELVGTRLGEQTGLSRIGVRTKYRPAIEESVHLCTCFEAHEGERVCEGENLVSPEAANAVTPVYPVEVVGEARQP
jgi:uncharacterized cupin superfamily protein